MIIEDDRAVKQMLYDTSDKVELEEYVKECEKHFIERLKSNGKLMDSFWGGILGSDEIFKILGKRNVRYDGSLWNALQYSSCSDWDNLEKRKLAVEESKTIIKWFYIMVSNFVLDCKNGRCVVDDSPYFKWYKNYEKKSCDFKYPFDDKFLSWIFYKSRITTFKWKKLENGTIRYQFSKNHNYVTNDNKVFFRDTGYHSILRSKHKISVNRIDRFQLFYLIDPVEFILSETRLKKLANCISPSSTRVIRTKEYLELVFGSKSESCKRWLFDNVLNTSDKFSYLIYVEEMLKIGEDYYALVANDPVSTSEKHWIAYTEI